MSTPTSVYIELMAETGEVPETAVWIIMQESNAISEYSSVTPADPQWWDQGDTLVSWWMDEERLLEDYDYTYLDVIEDY